MQVRVLPRAFSSGVSSIGRASGFQPEGREFASRTPHIFAGAILNPWQRILRGLRFSIFSGGDEFDADGGFDGGDGIADGGELSGLRVDAEEDEGVGVLVGEDHEMAGGVAAEVAGGFAEGVLIADEGELSGGLVDGVEGEVVGGEAVGGVEEFSGGVDLDFGGGVALFIVFEGLDDLELGKGAEL